MPVIAKKRIRIAASIMCADSLNLQRDIRVLEHFGVDILHLDIMDGHFVKNLALSMDTINEISRISKTPKEIHLLVSNPDFYIGKLSLTSKDTVIFHRESTRIPEKLVTRIKKLGFRAGIAYNPSTVVKAADVTLGVDHVLIMATSPGFKGHKFIQATKIKLDRVQKIFHIHESKIDIEVDGGLNVYRIRQLHALGANIFVAGSSTVFRDSSIAINIKSLIKEISALKKTYE